MALFERGKPRWGHQDPTFEAERHDKDIIAKQPFASQQKLVPSHRNKNYPEKKAKFGVFFERLLPPWAGRPPTAAPPRGAVLRGSRRKVFRSPFRAVPDTKDSVGAGAFRSAVPTGTLFFNHSPAIPGGKSTKKKSA